MTDDGKILKVKRREQYRTVDELVKRSEPSQVYYTLLVLSSFIVASGLLLDNSTIVIGGMLITPVLAPILMVALGLAIGRPDLMRKVGMSIAKSFLVIIASSVLLTLLFGGTSGYYIFENTVRTAALYFVVALAAGVAATFAWTRKELAEVLPGIAIAVSLVPPLSLIGISLSSFDFGVARFSFLIFLLNMVGILGGSLVVFSLLKFYKNEKEIEKKVIKADGKIS